MVSSCRVGIFRYSGHSKRLLTPEKMSQGNSYYLSSISHRKIGLRTSDFGFRTSDFGFRISDFGLRLSDFGYRISVIGFRISDFGFRISDFGFRTSAKLKMQSLDCKEKDKKKGMKQKPHPLLDIQFTQ
jgi:hypothetical protein